MSKAVLISIHPRWCEKIASGEKTIEIRKTRPKLETPFRCYIYRTKGTVSHIINGKWVKMEVGGTVVGEFTCDEITRVNISGFWDEGGQQLENRIADTCLTPMELCEYAGERVCYGWHISDLKIYDTPRELGEFERPYECDECNAKWASECNACHEENKIKRAPQSWCYVEEVAE